MAVTLRDAVAGDAAGIAAIWNPVIRDTTITFTTIEKTQAGLVADIADRAAQGRPWVVAEEDRQIIGFAGYAPFRSGPGYAFSMEHSIMLAPSAQGQGLGKRLLNHTETRALAGGATTLIGGVSGDNAPALAFHRATGFDSEVCLPGVGWKFGRALDLILFIKKLS